jgi:arylformamidase
MHRKRSPLAAKRLQRLDFYAARKVLRVPAPLFVFVHGGGWRQGDKSNATGVEKVDPLTRARLCLRFA